MKRRVEVHRRLAPGMKVFETQKCPGPLQTYGPFTYPHHSPLLPCFFTPPTSPLLPHLSTPPSPPAPSAPQFLTSPDLLPASPDDRLFPTNENTKPPKARTPVMHSVLGGLGVVAACRMWLAPAPPVAACTADRHAPVHVPGPGPGPGRACSCRAAGYRPRRGVQRLLHR